MNNKYKFSVIVPVYNVEEYLAEALDSVVNQSIGFEENIQLIIVNDGSPDNSAEICKKYRDRYPDNIVYIEKENGGVSTARNEGMKYIEGKYVNFLDSDDKWDLNAFRTAYNFFEKHYDEIDALACRMKYFEAKSGFQLQDYKFNKGTRIADLNNPEEYFSVQVFVISMFIKAKTLKEFCFDPRQRYGEDIVFCNKIMLEKCKIGLLKEALFYYRKRLDKTSAYDNLKYDNLYRTEMYEYCHKELFNYSIKKYGKVIPYIQAIVSYDLLWSFNICETHEILNDKEFSTFQERSKELLQQIDDSIIFGHPLHGPYTRRSVAINFKYGVDYFKSLRLEGNQLYFREYKVFNLAKATTHCVLNSVSADNNKFRFEMLLAKWLLMATESGGRFVLKVGERFVRPKEMLEYMKETVPTIDGGEYYYTSCIFHIKPKLKAGETLQITPYLVYGKKMSPIYLNCNKFSAEENVSKTCRVQGKYTVAYADKSIRISR